MATNRELSEGLYLCAQVAPVLFKFDTINIREQAQCQAHGTPCLSLSLGLLFLDMQQTWIRLCEKS